MLTMQSPKGFCDEAWKAVYQYVFALAHGADKGLFYYGDWIKEPGVAILSCRLGLCIPIFSLNRGLNPLDNCMSSAQIKGAA